MARRTDYDAVDNRIEVQENGQPFVTYEYDALGRSVRKTFDGYVTRFVHAGPWVVEELFAHGQTELAHEQAQRVAGKGLSFAPVIAGIQRMVG